MQRTEEKGWVTLDWTEELQALREKIEDILAYYNPTNPVTIEMISRKVEDLIRKVNSKWQGELTNQGSESAKVTSSALFGGMLAVVEIARQNEKEGANDDQEGNESDC